MTIPVSVFIIACNEADRIAVAINSVKSWVDEVIVVDSGSGDDTVKIAESLGAKVFFNAWHGYGEQKRFGEDQCKNQWLLNLDADEEITPVLRTEIEKIFDIPPPIGGRLGGGHFGSAEQVSPHPNPPPTGEGVSGYILQIRDLLPGEMRLAPMAHTNFVLRLYDKECGRFSDSPVHDSVILHKGGTRMLTHPVLHRSFRNLAHAIDKMNSYSSAQAKNLAGKGLDYVLLRLISEFPVAFFKVYFLRGYALRGTRGFIYSVNYAFGRFVRIAKYWELTRKL